MIELALRLVDLRLRLPVLRMFGDREVRIAAELGELHLRLLVQGGELALVVVERVARLVVNGLGHSGTAQQHGIAVVIDLIEVDLRLLSSGVAHHALVVLLHRLDRQRGLRQIGLGVVERDLELAGIEPIEHLPGGDVLIVLNRNILNDARHVG